MNILNVNITIEGALGIAGTGLWPFVISDKFIPPYISSSFLTRDYLAVLYVPFIPLGLSQGDWMSRYEFVSRSRTSARFGWGKELAIKVTAREYKPDGNMFFREKVTAFLRIQWSVAMLVAVVGAILGYMLAGKFGFSSMAGAASGCGLLNRLFTYFLSRL